MIEKPSLDIYSLPLHRSAGQETVKLPGLLVKDAPQRAHRSRRGDILFLFLSMNEAGTLTHSQIEELLEELASLYFKSRGTVTTSLRSVAEELNNFLLKRNQTSQSRRQATAVLNLAVLRGKQIFVIHAGETHSFSLGKKGIQHFYEPFTAGRGLGVSRTVQLSYFQADVDPGALLIFCPHPPESWSSSLLDEISRLPLGQIRRRIMRPDQDVIDLRAVLIQFRRGRGRIYQPRAQGIKSETPEKPEPIAPQEEPQVPSNPQAEEFPLPETKEPQLQPIQTAHPPASPADEPITPPLPSQEPAPAAKQTVPPAKQRGQSEVKEKLADLWVSGKAAQGKLRNRLSQMFIRFQPEGSSPFNLPPRTMLAIAIIIPLLVAVIASAVYFTTDRKDQRQQYLSQAVQAASEADLTSDPTLRASGWMQVLAYLDKADSLGASEESVQLRIKAEETLDAIHDITRVIYYPLLPTSINRDWNITSMVADQSDVYMLDSVSGSVKRLYQTGQDFEFTLDENFNCGPGQVGDVTIQRIVGITQLNRQMFDKPIPHASTLLALDEAGHYLFCIPNLDPIVGTIPAPSEGWGEIKDINVNPIGLFVLSPDQGLWFYKHDDSEEAKELTYEHENNNSRSLFANTITDLHNIADIIYFDNQVYLLRSSGTMMTCDPWIGIENQEDGSIEIVEDTKCTSMPIDLAQYAAGDAQISITSFQHQFSQMMSNSVPPHTYITLMDSQQAVLYQFTAGLKTLNEKYYPKFDQEYQIPEGQPTAFTIATPENRIIFLAYGDQVFKAVP